MDVFADAADLLFGDSAAFDATWSVGGVGPPIAIRVLKSSPDKTINYGQSRALAGTDIFRIRKSELAAPAAKDVLTLADGSRYALVGEPAIDTRGIIWTCEAKRL